MDENNELIIYFAAAAKEDPTPNEYLMSKERYFFGFDSLALALSLSTFFGWTYDKKITLILRKTSSKSH